MSLDRTFEALASTPRRKILALLSEGEMTAGDIANQFNFSKPALSGHLRVLEEAGLIAREKRGQFVYFSFVKERLVNTVFVWASEVCPVSIQIKRKAKNMKAISSDATASADVVNHDHQD